MRPVLDDQETTDGYRTLRKLIRRLAGIQTSEQIPPTRLSFLGAIADPRLQVASYQPRMVALQHECGWSSKPSVELAPTGYGVSKCLGLCK